MYSDDAIEPNLIITTTRGYSYLRYRYGNTSTQPYDDFEDDPFVKFVRETQAKARTRRMAYQRPKPAAANRELRKFLAKDRWERR